MTDDLGGVSSLSQNLEALVELSVEPHLIVQNFCGS